MTSPLIRAHKTAEIVSEVLQVPLHVHEGLKERFLGRLEGTVKADLGSIAKNYTQTAEGSECIDAFKKRITDTLHEILHPDHVTLIVAHGGVYWALMNTLGFEHASSNAIPHFFSPKEKGNKEEWLVIPISELGRVD